MSAQFEAFTASNLRIGTGLLSSTISVINAYVAFNNGSTSGKLKLYAYLQNIPGVRKVRSEFLGLELITSGASSTPAPAPVVEEQAPIVSPQMSEYERRMLEINQQRIEVEKELRAKELASNEKMKGMELERMDMMRVSQEKMKDKDLLNEDKNRALQAKMKDMELECQARLKEMDMEDKEKDRAFIRVENNKNRKMYIDTRFNKFLDMQVYGTPSTQYITHDSLVDVLGFNVYNALGGIDQPTHTKICDGLATSATDVAILNKTIVESVKAVNVADVDAVIHSIIDTMGDKKAIVAETLRPLLDLAKTIPEIAIRDEHRYLDTTYMSKKQRQDPEKYKTLKPKISYVKAMNELTHDTTGIHIKCFCCRDVIDMTNAGCHRSHDIPRSDGGDASRDNIYLCCATCNQAMGDCMSVIDYKTELYVKALDAMPPRTISAEH
jgi:hypothetical protein